jgi:hypothetical protein
VTPGSVNIRSSGERVGDGSDSTSARVTVPPTTTRDVSTGGASPSLTTTDSAASPAGRKVKSSRTLWPASVVTPLLSPAAKPALSARSV